MVRTAAAESFPHGALTALELEGRCHGLLSSLARQSADRLALLSAKENAQLTLDAGLHQPFQLDSAPTQTV